MNFFERVKESILFEDVARDYGIEFNRSGKALCPFHDEKTPSFSLHPSGLYAKCFGCGVSVDVIELEYRLGHHPARWDAAKALNDKYHLGFNFNGFDKEKAEEISNAYELLNWYCRQNHKALLENKEAFDWLKEKKGITIEDVKEHCIGYVSDGWLRGKVTEKNRALALKLGLLKEKEGKIYDAFRNRLTFPVYKYDRIVSIWAREFPDKENSSYKWLGLSNSELIPHKPMAWVENLNCEICILVESISDALAFLKVGVPACALLGKEVSEANRVYFEKAKAKLYFALDSDEAGKKASYERAKEFKGYTIDLGHEKDQDEVLVELGTQEFKKLAEKTIGEAKFYLDAVIENESKNEALEEIATLEMKSDQDIWINKLALKYKPDGVTESSLRDDLDKIKNRKKEPERTATKTIPKPEPIDLLTEPKPSLHPAMDLIDGNLAYGTTSGDNLLLIYKRKVLDFSTILKRYSVTNPPQPNRFSPCGIKTYVNGAEIRGSKLYKKIRNLLCRYIIFKESWQSYLITLWIIGTYLYRCFPLYPYLWIQSLTKRCAKTRLLELLSELSFNSNGIETAPTEAVLCRVPAITAGALCWDEAENLHNHEEKGERLSILNVAYRNGGRISRCEGKNHDVKTYEVFRPIAFAGISSLPDTVADRSLKIELLRKRKDEKVERLQLKHLESDLQSLRNGLHIFALERTPVILEAYNSFRDDLIPEGVDDRLRDALEILFSIAAGIYRYDTSDFPPILSYLQDAARALGGIRTADEDDTTFIRAINVLKLKIEENQQQELILTSQEAVNVLKDGGLDWIAEPKDARKVLRRLGCSSGTHRKGGEVIRGYLIEKERLEDLFQRYGGTFAE